MIRINRRDFTTAAAGITIGAGIGSFSDLLRAEGATDDHHFIFIELRGGIHWITAIDGRDQALLPMDDPKRVVTFKITDQLPTEEEYTKLVENDDGSKGSDDGEFLCLPYLEDVTSSYKKGKTTLGCDYVLGFTAFALEPYVNDIAVVRGTHVLGDFHGLDNAGGEEFSGLRSGTTPHVASVLAKLLTDKYGGKILDNLVFDNANYTLGTSPLKVEPIRIDSQSLGYLVANSQSGTSASVEANFAKAKRLAEAQSASTQLSELHREIFKSYVNAMPNAPKIRTKLVEELASDLSAVDASLDIRTQFYTAFTLLQAGLTRVATLCVGAANGKNKVDGFGLFDCHRGLYHIDPSDPGRENTQRHHRNVTKAMDGLAEIIKKLKTTKYKDTEKTWFDVTTVVVGTEFARPSNFAGNEAPGGEATSFGNGHYNKNNNYILFGKGVKAGAWVGQNEAIRQTGARVDFASLASGDPLAVKYTPVTIDKVVEGEGDEAFVEYSIKPTELNYEASDNRPFMARDVVRTVMAVAGVEARFNDAYNDETIKNAVVIKPLVG